MELRSEWEVRKFTAGVQFHIKGKRRNKGRNSGKKGTAVGYKTRFKTSHSIRNSNDLRRAYSGLFCPFGDLTISGDAILVEFTVSA